MAKMVERWKTNNNLIWMFFIIVFIRSGKIIYSYYDNDNNIVLSNPVCGFLNFFWKIGTVY